jgi:hypothetical protein
MQIEIKNLLDLKTVLNTLTEKQLVQPVRICETDVPIKSIGTIDILEEDYINPSGECAEKLSSYQPGGEHYNEEDDYSDEPIVATVGDVFLFILE